MAINEQEKLTVPFANSGLRNDIPETATGSNLASMQEGFPAVTMTDIASGGQPPDGKDFNGILNVITKILQYTQSGGLYKYDSDYATAMGGYPVGAILRSADGSKIWMNTTANNSSDPDNGGQNWAELTNASALASAISTVEGLVSAEATARTNAVSAEATARANAVSAEATARANAVSALQSSKQNNLTFDSTPTAGSSNPVTSGGIKTAIDNIDALPSQTGNAGKVLGTDGTEASWVSPPSGMVIGQNIESLVPLTDAGIHLYDGSLIASGGMYDGFVQFASALQTSHPELFCTQAEFDLSVSKYGVCSKFVASSSGVRLPKLYSETRYLVKAWSSSTGDKWYNLYSDGWIEQGETNIILSPSDIYSFEKEFRDTSYSLNTTSVLGGQNAATNGLTVNYSHSYFSTSNKTTTGFKIGGNANVTFPKDIYACGYAKETPDQEKIYRYICVATSVKTPVEVNIDNIITDNNNKADKDFANVTKPYVVEMGENSAGWWKIYSNGWVEQGGKIATVTSASSPIYTVKFPVEMRDTSYSYFLSSFSNGVNANTTDGVRAVTEVSMDISRYGTGTSELSWKVEGWKA